MSVTNCAISHMVESELKHVGYLLLVLLRNENPNELNEFVARHTILLSKIDEKQKNVVDPIHVDDLKIERSVLLKLQNALPSLKQAVADAPRLDANGNLPNEYEAKISAVQGKEKTMHEIWHCYKHCLECLAWRLLSGKLLEAMDELCELIKSIQLKVSVAGISKDKKDDLLIMWKNAKLILSLVMKLAQANPKSNDMLQVMGKRTKSMSKKQCARKSMKWVKRAKSGRNKSYCRSK